MTAVCLISVICHDRAGLVADISGHLFDLNANLSDTTFAVLGDMAEFTCIAEIPDDVPTEKVQRDLETVEGVAEGRVTVATFDMRAVHDESGHITHRIELDGPDAPGLILRIAEVFGSFGANIVRNELGTHSGAWSRSLRDAVRGPYSRPPGGRVPGDGGQHRR